MVQLVALEPLYRQSPVNHTRNSTNAVTPTENNKVAIVDDASDRTGLLAQSCGLELIAEPNTRHSFRFTLQWIDNRLTLRDHEHKTPIDIAAEFTQGGTLHRKKFGGGHGQPVARAVKTKDRPLICDATAGFGKDAFIFACLECEVIMLEQSVVVHALLADALERAKQDPETEDPAQRMTLYHADSTQLPGAWPHHRLPDVIYLDPMYPQGRRTAKKEIQTLRHLLDSPQSESDLLDAAKKTAKRVVVKRPGKAQPLAGSTPSGSITSPKTRYDIYGT